MLARSFSTRARSVAALRVLGSRAMTARTVSQDKVVVTAALNGVLTDPKMFPDVCIPVSPEEMAQAASEAFDAGATIAHIHFRDPRPGKGHLPTWDPQHVVEIASAIRERVPRLMLNFTTGTVGESGAMGGGPLGPTGGPLACIEAGKPEIAALNAGSLNYLKVKRNGEWAWPPMIFENSVAKVSAMIEGMREHNVVPECECFDTGIVRSIGMYEQVMSRAPALSLSLVATRPPSGALKQPRPLLPSRPCTPHPLLSSSIVTTTTTRVYHVLLHATAHATSPCSSSSRRPPSFFAPCSLPAAHAPSLLLLLRAVLPPAQAGILRAPIHVSFVMGVASGMPCKPQWVELLADELAPTTHWQTIAIGRAEEVWPTLRRTAELGGNVRSGVEDTFYLPDGSRARNSGDLIDALVKVCREVGREPASPEETRALMGMAPL